MIYPPKTPFREIDYFEQNLKKVCTRCEKTGSLCLGFSPSCLNDDDRDIIYEYRKYVIRTPNTRIFNGFRHIASGNGSSRCVASYKSVYRPGVSSGLRGRFPSKNKFNVSNKYGLSR